ncbi:hypothetical protein [Streptomyces sp. NPDC001435]|uniref:hypothetical protein n=1 Tax=unclassified Streptomyces TaxID=2593676 RepID=UPI003689AA5E
MCWPRWTLSRLELVGETLRAALEELAEAAPGWLAPLIEPEWAKRYGRRVEIGKLPGGKAAVTARAEEFGRDGQKILTASWAACDRLGIAPEEAVMMDDLQQNLDGAARIGIGGVLHTSAADTRRQLAERFGITA